MAQIQGSQIKIAKRSNLIIIGETVSISKKPFIPLATNEPQAYQSIVFRVEKVIKGNFSEKFLRTMIVYHKETLVKMPQTLINKVGVEYIVFLNSKVKPNECMQTENKKFENQDCYLVSNNGLIPALEDEIESVNWLVELSK